MATIKDYEDEGSAMGRVTAWKAAMQMMFDHPLLGVGAGHFTVAFGISYMPPDIVGPYPWLTAHSIYFLVIGELGIPGIVTLLVLVIGNPVANSRLRRAVLALPPDKVSEEHRRGARTLHMLNASMVGYAVAGAFLSAVYYPHMYVLVALMVVQRRTLMNGLGITQNPQGFAARRARRLRATTAGQGTP
jgi:O-antigen ligase